MKTEIIMIGEMGDIVSLSIIYESALDGAREQAYWNVDRNIISLSYQLYGDFKQLPNQVAQRKFIQGIKKISQYQIV